jgi:predicted acyltransferase
MFNRAKADIYTLGVLLAGLRVIRSSRWDMQSLGRMLGMGALQRKDSRATRRKH